MNDLLVSAARVFCARSGLDGPGSVAARAGQIVSAGESIHDKARQTFTFPDGVLLPGLIDLHAHPAVAGSVFGVDPDRYLLPYGTTTVLSQGDAGADNLAEFVETTVESSQTRVRLAINLSRKGESTPAGCLSRLEDADVDACIRAISTHREHIWGVAINASRHACGASDPRELLRRARVVAERTGLPLLYGMRPPEDWAFAEQLELLRSGDVVTYCFRREPHCITAGGVVHSAICAARERGIYFDLGHGAASFSFETASDALRKGFAPDTISTDFQQGHVGASPNHDLPSVMSKLRAAGMAEREIFTAVTATPTRLLRLEHKTGSLAPGMCADFTVLKWSPGPFELRDTHGETRSGGRWEVLLTVRAGQVV